MTVFDRVKEAVVGLALLAEPHSTTTPPHPDVPERSPASGSLDPVAPARSPKEGLREHLASLAKIADAENPPNTFSITQPFPRSPQASNVNLNDPKVKQILENMDPQNPATLRNIPENYLKDREFMIAAVRRFPEVLDYADAKIVYNKDFLHAAITEKTPKGNTFYNLRILNFLSDKRHPILNDFDFMKGLLDQGLVSALRWAGNELLQSKPFFRAVVEAQGNFRISDISPQFFNDEPLMRAAFERCSIDSPPAPPEGRAFKDYVGSEAFSQPAFWEAVATGNGHLLKHAPDSIWENHSCVKSLILKSGGSAYLSAPAHIKENPDLARIFVRVSPGWSGYLPKVILENNAFLSAELKWNGYIFKGLPKGLKQIPANILNAVEGDAGMLAEVPELKSVLEANPGLAKLIAERSYNTRPILEQTLGRLPEDVAAAFDSTRGTLQRLGFTGATLNHASHPDVKYRYGRFDRVNEVIANRNDLSNGRLRIPWDNRPTVAVILPRADERGAFLQNPNGHDFVDQLMPGNRVFVFEVGTKDQLVEVTNKLAKWGGVDNLVVAPHGSPTIMSFGSLDPARFNIAEGDPGALTVKDFGTFLRLAPDAVVRGGRVLAVSCDTGRDIEGGPNIAESLGGVWPHASVTAPLGVVEPPKLVDPATGEIIQDDVSFSRHHREVPSLTLPAHTSLSDLAAGGASSAAKFVLERSTYPFRLEASGPPNRRAMELNTVDGDLVCKFSQPVPPPDQKDNPSTAQFADRLAARVILERVGAALRQPVAQQVVAAWENPAGTPGYLDRDDPRLVATKNLVGATLGVDGKDVRLSLDITNGKISWAEIRILGVRGWETPIYYNPAHPDKGDVNLKTLGNVLNYHHHP